MNEEYITKRRAVELWDNNLLQSKDAGMVKELRRIHAYLFQDVFDFAGELRTVNLSKGKLSFCPRPVLRAKP